MNAVRVYYKLGVGVVESVEWSSPPALMNFAGRYTDEPFSI